MKPFNIDVKRFRVPVEVEVTCPHCGETNHINFNGDRHLSYPKANTPIAYSCLCDHCDEELDFKVILKVDLQVVT